MEKEKKIQIIRAAVKRFSKHGINKTTLDEIARDLRIGKTTLYHYFKSKEELFFETINWEASNYLDEVKQIFSNNDISTKEKFKEYFVHKISVKEKFRLLYDLIFLLVKNESFVEEVTIGTSLISREENLIRDALKLNQNKSKDDMIASYIVTQSWGFLFETELYKSTHPEKVENVEQLYLKFIENLNLQN